MATAKEKKKKKKKKHTLEQLWLLCYCCLTV